ncbi:H-NS family nucleoid-associated regulatory protein [Burkholderia territorii]|uniref:H-NS histone family protein n=1 Tax=Burkholderia territorii TaxID=1503055 RepID=UPI0009BD035C|nr:H-NS histone family protein [Burkholderia territorii]
MPTYQELLAQLRSLQEQIEAARLAERETALSQAREFVETYGLTEREVFGRRHAQAAKRTAPPKYRNPKTGETWTGRGRAPAWIAVQDREQFLIHD